MLGGVFVVPVVVKLGLASLGLVSVPVVAAVALGVYLAAREEDRLPRG